MSTEATHDSKEVEIKPEEPTPFSQTSAKGVLERQGFTIEDNGDYVHIYDDGREDISFACGAMWADGWRVFMVNWEENKLGFKQDQ